MVEGGRAVWARGACTKSPSVSACVGLAPLPLAPDGEGAVEQRSKGGTGRGFPQLAPASSAGRRSDAPAGMEEGLLPRAWPVPAAWWGSLRYSMTRQCGRCCEKYLKSSGVAPGQLVSSSSSSSCSCTRPDSPVVVRSGQPESVRHRDSRSAVQLRLAGGLDWAGQEGKAEEDNDLLGVDSTGLAE